MNIYMAKPITQNQEENFRPCRLYIKELLGIKYFGKYSGENIEKYTGSGTIWHKRIKKYGRQAIKTVWLSDWFRDPYHIQQFALMFSELNCIVESNDWANLRPEDGLSGGTLKGHCKGRKYTDEQRAAQLFNNTKPEVKHNRSIAQKEIQKEIQNRSEVKQSISDTLKSSEVNVIHRAACRASWDLIPDKRENRMGIKNPSYIHTIYNFKHNNGTIENCTKYELRKKYNLNKSNLYKIIGTNRSCEGWKNV